MLEISIEIAYGRPAEKARHLSGVRRSGLPTPECAGCGAPLFCIFSIDGTDPVLAGSPLGGEARDFDFFVCPACMVCSDACYVRFLPDGSCQTWAAWQEPPIAELVFPYPVSPLVLQTIERPTDQTIDEMGARKIGSGVYHRISGRYLWGEPIAALICPHCDQGMQQVAIIDSDDKIPLRRFTKVGERRETKCSLNWVDGDTLAVGRCRSCDCWGYVPAR